MNFRMVASFLLMSLGLALHPALAEEQPLKEEIARGKKDRADYHAFVGYEEKVVRYDYNTSVKAIAHRADGSASVTFQAFNQWDRKLDQRTPSDEILQLEWTDTKRPVPLCEGLGVLVGTDENKKVRTMFTGGGEGAEVYAICQRADGDYEFLLRVSKYHHSKRPYLRIYPNRADFFTPEIHWNDKYGLFMAYFEAGAGGGENDSLLRSMVPGVRVANVPGEKITPGRDGWKLMKGWWESSDYWGKSGASIPAQHYGPSE